MPLKMPTERDMQKAFHHTTFGRYELIMPNVHISNNEMDIIGIRKSGFVDEIEIKTSKSDFLADFKKSRGHCGLKHSAIKRGTTLCNYFAYLLPEELIDECKIPSYAGLYVFKHWDGKRGGVVEAIKPPLLHRRKVSDVIKYKTAQKAVYRYWALL
jgi:hypothetical protein